MKKSERFRVGFFDSAIQSKITDEYPKLIPVVDNHYGWGRVVTLCDNEDTAKVIASVLEAHKNNLVWRGPTLEEVD